MGHDDKYEEINTSVISTRFPGADVTTAELITPRQEPYASKEICLDAKFLCIQGLTEETEEHEDEGKAAMRRIQLVGRQKPSGARNLMIFFLEY